MPTLHNDEKEVAGEHSALWKHKGTITFGPHNSRIDFKCEKWEVIPANQNKRHAEIRLSNVYTRYFDGSGAEREFAHHHEAVTYGGEGVVWTIVDIGA